MNLLSKPKNICLMVTSYQNIFCKILRNITISFIRRVPREILESKFNDDV